MSATIGNTAVVTAAFYPEGKMPWTNGLLNASAHRLGITMWDYGFNEPYQNHVHGKVTRLKERIRSLNPEIKYVLYVDARDVMFAWSMVDIVRAYNEVGATILMCAEPLCYPCRLPEWADRFPKVPGGYNYLNAGCFMGPRDVLVSTLTNLEHIGRLVLQEKWNGTIQRFGQDDHYLWQLAYIEGFAPVVPDSECRLFLNVTLTHPSMIDHGSNVLKLKNGSQPAVIHFPGDGICAMPTFAQHYKLT